MILAACRPRAIAGARHGGVLPMSARKLSTGLTNLATEPHEPGFLQSVGMYFDRAAKHSGLSPEVLKHIKSTDAVLSVTFPVEKNGKTVMIKGYR
ncbi:NADP-dependent glutamate dehydrogenase, partial [Coemansia erecta]